MRKILGCIKRAQAQFGMIQENDVVAVGCSGGKDSMVLLHALHLYQYFSDVNYTLKAVTMDMGFPQQDLSPISQFCLERQIEHIIKKTNLSAVIFEERKESNPCSLCARMRRGCLNNMCEENGISKLALGHHGDDLLETFFLNMFYEIRLSTFSPVTEFERTSTIMIRPLLYATEEDVSKAAINNNIPIIPNPCPVSGHTKRDLAKKIIADIEEQLPGSRLHMIHALCYSDIM